MLPEADGIELMQQIRQVDDLPVIFVSAYGQDQLIARAFAEGAADYVVKPFSPTELLARIGAALRRREHPEPVAPYVAGALVIEYAERRVTLAGAPVRVTALEYRLLAELARHAGRVVPYAQLLRRVWHVDPDGDVRPIRTVVNALRRKLADNADHPTYLSSPSRASATAWPSPSHERASPSLRAGTLIGPAVPNTVASGHRASAAAGVTSATRGVPCAWSAIRTGRARR